MPKGPDQLMRLNVSQDGLQAVLLLEPGIPLEEATEAAVQGLLAEQGLVNTAEVAELIRAAIAAFRAAPGTRLEQIVARGTGPVHAQDPAIELDPRLTGKIPVDASKKVSYYDRQAFHAVRAGERMGRVRPPVPGQDGADVRGRSLAARQPKPLTIRIDESVSVRDGDLWATCDGLLEFTAAALRIVRDLEVRGYVDFSTGNIDFPGDVVVQKGVRDCFEVRVGGSLTVRELVEAATLACGRDGTLSRGMAGREKGSLTVGRDLAATYIAGTRVQVGRDARIGKEMINCDTTVGRDFRSAGCVVAGGTLRVGAACEVAQLGSEGATATEVWLGCIPSLDALLARTAQAIVEVDARCTRARTRLAELRRATAKLAAAQAEELAELEFQTASWESRRAALLTAAATAAQTIRASARADLTVHGHLHTGVRLHLGCFSVEPRSALRGPIRISLDGRGDPVLTELTTSTSSPMTQLAKVTREHEPPQIPGLELAPVAKAA